MYSKATLKKSRFYLALLMPLSDSAFAQWFFDVEAGLFKADHNDVQIPNDSQGDRFDITDLGDGPFPGARLTLGWLPAENHELQLVYAPFSYTEKGAFDEDIRFNGATFLGGQPVKARYQFTNYRLRYLYHWIEQGPWELDVGGTLFVRDASIELTQNGTRSEDDDLGLVPLLALRSTYTMTENWSARLDTDFAFAPQGRAIDLALLANYRLDHKWTLSGGYRTIEGGADNDDVYTFAWFNGVVLKATYSW